MSDATQHSTTAPTSPSAGGQPTVSDGVLEIPPETPSQQTPPVSGHDGQAHASAPAPATEGSQDLLNKALARKADADARVAQESISRSTRFRNMLNAVSGLAGFVLAIAGLATGYITVMKWFDDRTNERELQIETQFSRTVSLLSSTKASDHAAAAIALSPYVSIDQPERSSRALLAVASAIAGETDRFAQRTMVEFFNALDYGKIDPNAKNVTLQALINYDRALADSIKLHGKLADPLPPLDTQKLQTLASLATVIAKLVVGGAEATNFSNLYLADTDFRHAVFPDHTDFSNSILAFADFSDTSLRGAIFHNTDIEAVKFVRAHMQDASIGYALPDTFLQLLFEQTHSTYLLAMSGREEFNFLTEFALQPRGPARWPLFTCANLAGATIENLPIGYVTFIGAGIDFRYADLSGTKFRPILYLLAGADPKMEFDFSGEFNSKADLDSGRMEQLSDVEGGVALWYIKPKAGLPFRATQKRRDLHIPFTWPDWFGHSNWMSADAEPWLRRYMESRTRDRMHAGQHLEACPNSTP